MSVLAEVGASAIAVGGILLMLGARRLAWRLLAVGAILAVSAALLGPNSSFIGGAHGR